MNSIKLFKLFGISLELHSSSIWLTLIGLIYLLLFQPNYLIQSIIFFILLFSSVFFHELSHSLTSLFFKIKVEKIILLPIGGIALTKKQSKKPLIEFLIAFSGPLFNFILAFILFIFLGLSGIETLAPVVGNIVENSPASKYNIQKQDKIIKINETEIKDWKDIFPNLQQNNNGKLNIVILRNNQKIFLNIQLDKNPKNNTWFLGITPNSTTLNIVKYNSWEAVQFGYDSVTKFTLLLIDGVKQLITNTIGLNQLGGFISIIDYTSKASEVGLNSLFFMLAFLSINLAVLNLLPIPALDGGQIILVVYEIIRGKKANEKIYYYLIAFSWILLVALMLIGIINDINRLIDLKMVAIIGYVTTISPFLILPKNTPQIQKAMRTVWKEME